MSKPKESKTMSLLEFLKLVSCVRMIYGQDAAGRLFEKSIYDFTGLTAEDFRKLLTPENS